MDERLDKRMDGWTGHREKEELIQLTLDDVDML